MAIIADEKWLPSDSIILEKNADVAIRQKRNVLVVAGPGAGKTELLAQKANYLFETDNCKEPYRILAISFKKDAAKNLKERVEQRCGKETACRFDSMTYDAFAKNLLDHFRLALPQELRPKQDYIVEDKDILKAAFEQYNNHNTRYYDAIISSVSLPFAKDEVGERIWKLLLHGFDDHTSMLTFKMISMLAEYIIRTNIMIRNGLQETYKYVFLDEFQDTTTLQYELVKRCFLSSKAIITAVGDNKQRIMVWAGARKTVFVDFQNDFNAIKYKLIMNHRSAPRLVDLQRKMYSVLNESDGQVQHSAKWREDDGIINLIISENSESEALTITNSIIKKIETGISPTQICILCKQKPQDFTQIIIDYLGQKGIYARIENDYQDLIKEPIIEIILSILSLTCNRKHPDDWKVLVSSIIELWNISGTQSDDEYFNVQNQIDDELLRIKQQFSLVTTKSEFYEVLKKIVSFLKFDCIKAVFPEYSQGKYLNDVLNRFAKLFWDELEKTSIDLNMSIEQFKGLHSIPIMTIHKSKGLEYDTVFFVGLEDAAFWNFKNQPEEDRCAFFVALSRAKSEVSFSFCKNRNHKTQKHNDINEFFDLLQEPRIANIITPP